MGDILGKMYSALYGAVIMFIVPIMILAINYDSISQSYIDNAIVEFVDNAKSSGKITPRAYERLCEEVDAAHLICEIKITHSSAYTSPTGVVDPATGYYEVETYRNDFIKEEILAKMYPDYGDNIDYQMKNGDYIKVEVVNVSPTLGSRMLRMFSTKTPDATLYATYGGYVGNNIQ